MHARGLPARARIRQAGGAIQGIFVALSARDPAHPLASIPRAAGAQRQFAARRAAARPTSRAAPRPKRSRGLPNQQCHGKRMRTKRPGVTSRCTDSSVKQLRQEPPGSGSRVSPHSPRQRHGKARHDRNEVLAAAKRQQPSQMAALRDQRLILGWPRKNHRFARAESRSTRAVIHSFGSPESQSASTSAARRSRRFLQQPRPHGKVHRPAVVRIHQSSSPTIRYPDRNPARRAQPA